MDHVPYSSQLEALATGPDPRQARGKQLEWSFTLGAIAGAVLSQQECEAAMAQWAQRHAAALVAAFQPTRRRVPSESTLRRALRRIDVSVLEQCLAQVPVPDHPDTNQPAPLHGQAVDGKHIRGAGAHGTCVQLVSLVEHGSGQVLAQTAISTKRHESRAVPTLLAGRDLSNVVITMDAGLTLPRLATQILAQGGHYLMVVKRNQHELYEGLTWYFDTPPLPCDRPWRTAYSCTKGHGRIECRWLTCTDDLGEYLTWPGVQQVLRRETERTIIKTGEVTRAVTYAITSLRATDMPTAGLAQLWREHWTIENRVHYVRDVTLGEDAHQMRTGHAPEALATIRNSLLNHLRADGWTNMAAAFRHYNGSVQDAMQFIGAVPSRP